MIIYNKDQYSHTDLKIKWKPVSPKQSERGVCTACESPGSKDTSEFQEF